MQQTTVMLFLHENIALRTVLIVMKIDKALCYRYILKSLSLTLEEKKKSYGSDKGLDQRKS